MGFIPDDFRFFRKKITSLSRLIPLHHIRLLGLISAVSLLPPFHKMQSHGSHIDKKLRVVAGVIPKLLLGLKSTALQSHMYWPVSCLLPVLRHFMLLYQAHA